jgi:hypothetical protein
LSFWSLAMRASDCWAITFSSIARFTRAI